MRAVYYEAYGPIENLKLGELPAPEPRRGELLVRVTRAALNPKDALFRKGKFRRLSGTRFPKRCGLDFAGVVLQSRSAHFREGQRVFGMLDEWRITRGSLAEQLTCREEEAAVLPDDVPDEAGAATALAGLTALQALRDVARVREGARVLIHGASGGVGTLAIQIGRRLGAHVETTSSDANLALCRALGAARAWDYATPELRTSAPRFDVVFDVFGNLDFGVVRPWLSERGLFVSTVPNVRRIVREVVGRVWPSRERLVVVKPRRADLATLAAWLQDGSLRAVIDARFRLDQVHAAMAHLESKRTRGKLVIEIG